MPFATSSSLTRRQRPRTHSRTHPQHARTHRHRKRSIGRCVFSPSCTAPRAAPTTLRSRSTPGGFPSLLQGSHPFLGRPFFLSFRFALRRLLFLSACFRVVPRATPARNQKPARSRAHQRSTDGRRDVRSAGMADWKTALRGNTERTLTAAAGPPPRDPYRQALTMRPSLRARPLVS